MTSDEKTDIITSYKDLIYRIMIIQSLFEGDNDIDPKTIPLLCDLMGEVELKFNQLHRNVVIALLQNKLKD